ncbi:MAG: flavodoxin domain-containing protein [Candidatus Sericytochromatia bacterium]
MSGLILYMGKYGSTSQYASWLAEDTGFEVVDLYRTPRPDLGNPEQVILGSSVHCGMLRIAGWINRNWPWLSQRQVFLFSVSGLTPESPLLSRLIHVNLGSRVWTHLHYHALPGRLIQSELDPLDRWLLKREADFGIHLGQYPGQHKGGSGDFNQVKRSQLQPLLQDLQSFRS